MILKLCIYYIVSVIILTKLVSYYFYKRNTDQKLKFTNDISNVALLKFED